MTFARLVLAASTNEPVPEPRTTTLPAEPTARALVQVYETIVLSLYPAFPGATLHALVSAYTRSTPDTSRAPSTGCSGWSSQSVLPPRAEASWTSTTSTPSSSLAVRCRTPTGR